MKMLILAEILVVWFYSNIDWKIDINKMKEIMEVDFKT